MKGRVYTIVPAAGSAIRMGLGYSKAYVEILGVPLLARTLKALLASRHVDRITAAVRPEEVELCQRQVVHRFGLSERVQVIGGGEERQQTVFNLLERAPSDRDLVLIHDGARPLVSVNLIASVLEAAAHWGAALAAVQATDTVKLSDDGGESVSTTLERSRVYLAQTPQAFSRDVILAAHRQARKEGVQATDDASLVEQVGQPVRIIAGDPNNLKITTLDDLERCRWILKARGGN